MSDLRARRSAPRIEAGSTYDGSMLAYTLKRLGLAVLVALAVSALAFLLLRASGDAAIALAGEGAREEDIENIRRVYGLDRPLLVQYLDWLGHMLRGDFGQSLYFKTDVLGLVLAKLPTTVLLAVLSLAVRARDLDAARRPRRHLPNSWIDRLCLALAVVGQALPNFFFALMLIMLFSIWLQLLPVSGSETWAHFVMPTIALGYYVAPAFMRLVRAGMIEVLASDYIRTARAKGLSGASIIFKHALRNAVVPVVALAAVQLGFLLGGSVVIETIFALDGLGYLAYQSITHKDFPVMQAIVRCCRSSMSADARRRSRQCLARSAHPRGLTHDRSLRARVRSTSPARRRSALLRRRVLRPQGPDGRRDRCWSLIVLMALLAPLLAPHDPYAQDLTRRLIPPIWHEKGTWAHPFGTDNLGRDYLSRVIYGARISLLIGFAVMVISGLIGTALGLPPAISAAASTWRSPSSSRCGWRCR